MVRFSVAEGKDEKRRKLLYASSSWIPTEPEEQEEDGDDNHEAEEDEHEAAACTGTGGGPNRSCAVGTEGGNGVKEAVTVIVDADVFDCPICCEVLAPPIFQCKNGHIACASCCTKMKKCHSCSCPIDSIRCLALENVIESIKVPCPYASNGCGEIVSYLHRRMHKETCIYSPCFCPIVQCTFSGSLQQLSHHFCSKHGDHAIFFLYNVPFEVSFCKNEPFGILLGEDGILFLLNNRSMPLGNAISLSCVGPDSLQGDFSYQLVARSKGSSIQLESCMTNIKRRWDGASPSKDFLLIPQDFCAVPGELSLNVCVRNKIR